MQRASNDAIHCSDNQTCLIYSSLRNGLRTKKIASQTWKSIAYSCWETKISLWLRNQGLNHVVSIHLSGGPDYSFNVTVNACIGAPKEHLTCVVFWLGKWCGLVKQGRITDLNVMNCHRIRNIPSWIMSNINWKRDGGMWGLWRPVDLQHYTQKMQGQEVQL